MVQTGPPTSPGSSPRTDRRKREILLAASRVFRRRGLHATGMRDIAEEIGMHVGNLYYYFRNKQDLLAFCQQDALDGLLNLAADIEAQELPPDQKLRQLIVGHIVRVNEETPGSLAHLEVEALTGSARETVQRRRDRYEAVYRNLIQDAVETGHFVSADPGVAARAILGALNWTVKWYRPDGDRECTQIAHEIAAIMVRGLAAPESIDAGPTVRAEAMKSHPAN